MIAQAICNVSIVRRRVLQKVTARGAQMPNTTGGHRVFRKLVQDFGKLISDLDYRLIYVAGHLEVHRHEEHAPIFQKVEEP